MYMKQIVYTQHFCNLCILFVIFNIFIFKNVMLCTYCFHFATRVVSMYNH